MLAELKDLVEKKIFTQVRPYHTLFITQAHMHIQGRDKANNEETYSV